MSLIKNTFAALALFSVMSAGALASTVTQTAGPGSYDASGWHDDEIIGVTLAQGTKLIDALTGSSSTYDQGWGNYSFAGNHLYIALVSNGNNLWTDFFAGGARTGADPIDQTYAISNIALTALNTALASIDWASTPDVEIQVRSSTLGWPGWELHSRNDVFSVTSEVPEPATIAMLAIGLMGLVAARRKARQ